MTGAPAAAAAAALAATPIVKKLPHEQDLTPLMAPYMDMHLLLPLLDFVEEQVAEYGYPLAEVQQAKKDVVANTSLYALLEELHPDITDELRNDLDVKKTRMVHELVSRHSDLQLLAPLALALDDLVRREELRKKSAEEIEKVYGKIDEGLLDTLYETAFFHYQCGSYQVALDLLEFYRILPVTVCSEGQEGNLSSPEKLESALWGAFASAILVEHWDKSVDLAVQLDELLEKAYRNRREKQAVNRAWWSHWMLFILFKSMTTVSPQCVQRILEVVTSRHHLAALSVTTPHLLRYIAATCVLHKRAQGEPLDRLVGLLQMEENRYSDPITKLLVSLYVDLDFDGAQQHLQDSQQLMATDFFLQDRWEEFCQNARLLIFESYCRIHQCINIDMIAKKLNMSSGEAEKWIVKLIQQARLDAKIDSERNRVVMGTADQNIFQQVLESTKNVMFKSSVLVEALEKRAAGGVA